jgi:hypothetical protein
VNDSSLHYFLSSEDDSIEAELKNATQEKNDLMLIMGNVEKRLESVSERTQRLTNLKQQRKIEKAAKRFHQRCQRLVDAHAEELLKLNNTLKDYALSLVDTE